MTTERQKLLFEERRSFTRTHSIIACVALVSQHLENVNGKIIQRNLWHFNCYRNMRESWMNKDLYV